MNLQAKDAKLKIPFFRRFARLPNSNILFYILFFLDFPMLSQQRLLIFLCDSYNDIRYAEVKSCEKGQTVSLVHCALPCIL